LANTNPLSEHAILCQLAGQRKGNIKGQSCRQWKDEKLSKALRHLRAQVLSVDNRAGKPRQVPSELAYPLSLFLIARLRTFYVGSHWDTCSGTSTWTRRCFRSEIGHRVPRSRSEWIRWMLSHRPPASQPLAAPARG